MIAGYDWNENTGVRNKTIIGLKYETWSLKTEDINKLEIRL